MKFLVDANLPPSLKDLFIGHDVMHTTDLPKGNLTPDHEINDLSILEKRILITKDLDFFYSFITTGKPFKLVLVKLGNKRIGELKRYFEANLAAIIDLTRNGSLIILEEKRLRLLR